MGLDPGHLLDRRSRRFGRAVGTVSPYPRHTANPPHRETPRRCRPSFDRMHRVGPLRQSSPHRVFAEDAAAAQVGDGHCIRVPCGRGRAVLPPGVAGHVGRPAGCPVHDGAPPIRVSCAARSTPRRGPARSVGTQGCHSDARAAASLPGPRCRASRRRRNRSAMITARTRTRTARARRCSEPLGAINLTQRRSTTGNCFPGTIFER